MFTDQANPIASLQEKMGQKVLVCLVWKQRMLLRIIVNWMRSRWGFWMIGIPSFRMFFFFGFCYDKCRMLICVYTKETVQHRWKSCWRSRPRRWFHLNLLPICGLHFAFTNHLCITPPIFSLLFFQVSLPVISKYVRPLISFLFLFHSVFIPKLLILWIHKEKTFFLLIPRWKLFN